MCSYILLTIFISIVHRYCVDAFEYMLSRHLMKSDDEEDLIEALPWKTQDDDWLRAFYETRVAPHRKILNSTLRNQKRAGPTSTPCVSINNQRMDDVKDKEDELLSSKRHDRFSHPALSKLLHGVNPPTDPTADEYSDSPAVLFSSNGRGGEEREVSFDGPRNHKGMGGESLLLDQLPPQPNVPLLAAKAELHW